MRFRGDMLRNSFQVIYINMFDETHLFNLIFFDFRFFSIIKNQWSYWNYKLINSGVGFMNSINSKIYNWSWGWNFNSYFYLYNSNLYLEFYKIWLMLFSIFPGFILSSHMNCVCLSGLILNSPKVKEYFIEALSLAECALNLRKSVSVVKYAHWRCCNQASS